MSEPIDRRVSRRDKLLNAAEYLFATGGYHIVSLKQISERAGVNIGLINYYFGTKENLFREVVERRSPDFIGRITRNHDQFERDSAVARRPFSELLRAHFMPFIEYAVSEDSGKRDYVRIVVDANFWQTSEIRETGAGMWRVAMRLFDLSQRCFPDADPTRLRVALYMAGTTMSYMFRDAWLLSEITGGRFHQDNLDEMFDLVEAFFEGGTEKLASRKPVTATSAAGR